MADEPEDSLEALLAADEAAIRDDGFSARVMTGVRPARQGLRRTVIGAAGALGMGVAGFSISSALKLLPPTEAKPAGGWLESLNAAGAQAALTDMATSPVFLLALAVGVAALISLAAAALQET